MTRQLSITRAVAVLGVLVRGRTYASILYLVLAFPLSVIYLLLLGSALILDIAFMLLRAFLLILSVLLYAIIRLLITILRLPVRGVAALIVVLGRHSAQEQPAGTDSEPAAQRWSPLAAAPRWIRQRIARWRWWIVLPALCWALATWERELTVRWLGIDMPAIVRPRLDTAPAGSTTAFPWTFLGYLLAKLPFAVLGGFLVGFAIEGLVLLKTRPVLPDGYTGTAIVAAVAIVIAALHGVDGLVRLWGRFAYAMIAMNDTVRRLRDAEQRAAQARASAERAEQSRRELIVNVSHELRTPIASIRAHVESITLALDDTTPGLSRADLRRYLGIVEREAERLGTLVDELLALARSETDKLQLTVAPVDVAAVIDEVYQALAPLARHERQVLLVRDVPSGLPPLLADRQRLVQVLLNLARNAITYTPAGGIVSLMAQPAEPDQLVVAIADTGSGIAPADLDRIFERFYRADTSRARASGGFGLGLAIVRELVEAMGGTITVESTLGEGSCFSVRLPIAEATLSAGKGG